MKKATKASSGQNSSSKYSHDFLLINLSFSATEATPGEQTADLKKFGKAVNGSQNEKDG
jgi:hypothetical protein